MLTYKIYHNEMSSSESDIKRSMCIENISAHKSENETYDHLAIDLELE